MTPVSWEAGSYQPSCTWHGTGCLETQADGNPRTQTDLNSDAGPLQPLLLWVHFGSFQDPLVGVATMHADCCPDSRGQRRLGHLGAVSRPPSPILTSQGALQEEGFLLQGVGPPLRAGFAVYDSHRMYLSMSN